MINSEEIQTKSGGVIHSHILNNRFEGINRLLDQFCQRCAQTSAVCEVGCGLSHRKNKVIIPFNVAHEMEFARLEV